MIHKASPCCEGYVTTTVHPPKKWDFICVFRIALLTPSSFSGPPLVARVHTVAHPDPCNGLLSRHCVQHSLWQLADSHSFSPTRMLYTAFSATEEGNNDIPVQYVFSNRPELASTVGTLVSPCRPPGRCGFTLGKHLFAFFFCVRFFF